MQDFVDTYMISDCAFKSITYFVNSEGNIHIYFSLLFM